MVDVTKVPDEGLNLQVSTAEDPSTKIEELLCREKGLLKQ